MANWDGERKVGEPLKNMYNQQFLVKFADALAAEYPQLDQHLFLDNFNQPGWEKLELMQRVKFLTRVLHKTLPTDFSETLNILKPVATQFQGFEYVVFPDYVATFGLDEFELSMDALAVFTEYSTSEFAVRPFIEKYGDRMMQQMLDWSQSDNHHVRRLASEGCRPRLPWGTALKGFKKDPQPILPILENLKQDETEYVRRSVANNLNDISKDHPELVKQIARSWKGRHSGTDRLVKHACRTLLKAGDSETLALFDYAAVEHITLQNLAASSQVVIGGSLEFSFDLQSIDNRELGLLRIEYAIGFHRPGRKPGRKVFKIK